MWKKGSVIVILFFIVFCNIPIINGSFLKINSFEDNIAITGDTHIKSYDQKDDAINILHEEDNIIEFRDKFNFISFSDYPEIDNKIKYVTHYTKTIHPPKIFKNERFYYLPDSNYNQPDNSQFFNYKRIKTSKSDNDAEISMVDFFVKNKSFFSKKNPSISNNNIIKFTLQNYGKIFYVGGSGPNNYSKIQDAIDNSSNGDTVFVYDDSSPYFENLVLDKSINLVGEDKESTTINGSKLNIMLDTIEIRANNVYINGLSIVENPGYYYQAAIKIVSDNVTISNCKFYNNNWIGISLLGSYYSKIIDCELSENLIAIHLVDSNENEINNCLCYENSDDIILFENSHYNKIINCTSISNGFSGIHIQRSSGNQIINCTCINGYEGIGLAYAPNTLMRGNIINNNQENFGIGSSTLSDFYCDIDTSNTINGKPIYYWIGEHDKQVPSDAAFIGLISCTNILVKDFQINNNFQGFVGAGISNCTIENCNFGNNGGHGMFFISSSDNIIRNCSVSNNFFSGVYLISQSDNNFIHNNTLIDIQNSGIWIEESIDNYLDGHIINNCYKGISLESSRNSILRNNVMSKCGLMIDGSSLSDYINDVDTSNTINGKPVYYYLDKNNIDIPSNAGEVILINCTYCNITNLDLSNGTIGVELAFSSYNNISGNIINNNRLVAIDLDCSSNNYNMISDNTIIDNNYAIDIDFSCCNTFSENVIYDNSVGFSFDSSDGNNILFNDIQNSWNGIYMVESDNNNIQDNDIKDCGFNGIYLLYSKNNVLKENIMENCGLLVFGSTISEYINNVDTSNKINGKILYYYINKIGLEIPNNAGQVILINCDNCNVTNLDLSDGTIGVELAYSDNNIISKNKLNNNNFAGVYLESSDENMVRENKIENNGYGVTLQLADDNDFKNNDIISNNYGCYLYLSNSNIFFGNDISYCTYGLSFNYPSNDNIIHHNNLIGNGYNAWDENEKTNYWDDGEKGNYWADYKDKYPNANKIWLKGIWSIPYDIPYIENEDRYPLILPHIISNEKTKNINKRFFSNNQVIFQILKQILFNKLDFK
jgi:parallel beta-helix repeat protein